MRSHIVPRSAAVLAVAAAASPAAGYIHFPPADLPGLCRQSHPVRVLTVRKFDREKGVLVFEATETLTGRAFDLLG
jgi:hypothetical protein